MRVSLSQKEKLNELFVAVEILFNDEKFGLMYSEIKEAWLVGGILRDILLFKNPPISDYDFYIQVKDKEDIYPWLSRLAENDISFDVREDNFTFNNNEVFQVIKLSLLELNIDYEINIFVGSVSPKDFMLNNFPIGISIIGLDVAELFISLSENDSVEKIVNKIWKSPQYKKDFKNKNISVLKQNWMKNPNYYTALEEYLEKVYNKLQPLGFNIN